MEELQHTMTMVEYKCWYYKMAQAAGTVKRLQNMKEGEVLEQFRGVRRELRNVPQPAPADVRSAGPEENLI